MDIQNFKTIIDTYGADPARWPEAQRGGLQRFIDENADAARPVLDAARQLDRVLESARQVAPSDLLMARIMTKTPRAFLADWRQAAAAAATALIIGVAGGYASGMMVADPDGEADYYADAFGGLDVEWDISAGDGA